MFLSDKFIGQNLPGSKAFRVKRSNEVGVYFFENKDCSGMVSGPLADI